MGGYRVGSPARAGSRPSYAGESKPDQLEPCVTVPSQERTSRANALEADDAFHPAALDVSFPPRVPMVD